MKKIFLSISILLLAIPQFLFGQQGWIKEFSGPDTERSSNLVKTQDGNYALLINSDVGFDNGIGAGSHLVKLDIEGNILFSNQLDSADYRAPMISTPDNGFLYLAGDFFEQYHVIKLDSLGNEEWVTLLNWADSTIASYYYDIILTTNGDFIITGKDANSTLDSSIVRRVDANFNEIWSYKKSDDYNLQSIAELSNGEIGIAGFTFTADGINRRVIKLDASGNEIWETSISDTAFTTGNSSVIVPKIVGLADGGFMAFNMNSQNARTQIRLDNDGNILWEKEIILSDTENNFYDIVQVSDGFILSGNINNLINSSPDVLLVKTDFNGNVVWEKKINNRTGTTYESGYSIIETDDSGLMGVATVTNATSFYLFKTDSLGRVYANEIKGTVAVDEQPNCIVDSNEIRMYNWIVAAQNSNHTYYTSTDSFGNYHLPLDTGDYVLTLYPPSPVWDVCENDINVSVNLNSIITEDFPIEAMIDCPYLIVGTAFPLARPCFDNNKLYVNYCNQGSLTASDTYIEIEIDSNLTYVSSSINLTAQVGNTLTFDLGDVAIGECGDFNIDLMLDCDTDIGESICIDSHIYPDTFCITNPNWNGAFVEVDVTCEDSTATFYLENTGDVTMPSQNEYIVIEDAILLFTNEFQLMPSEIDSFSIPTNGSTFQLIAEQVENAPGDPYPTAWIEGCGTNGNGSFSLGYLNQFSLGDNNPFEDTDCTFATAAFDPNDKQGFPLGYDDEHFIRPNTDLEYQIRFQNTGTDTAFTVVIRDTIAPELDIPSIQVGAASHDYTWRIFGENVLEFTFNVIMLPDSNVNEPASHGFVEFKISQKEDLPLGTVIKNNAAIYFDYNDPIITNETFHTLGENFITVSTQRPIKEDYSLLVRPNPLQEFAIFEMKKEIKNGLFELYDATGKLAWQQKFNGSEFELKRNNLNAGIYFYKISENGNAINSGKIVVN
ncbi:MAG: T9SS type A sorting domain-containing protein [Saprospiraceae bacterium]